MALDTPARLSQYDLRRHSAGWSCDTRVAEVAGLALIAAPRPDTREPPVNVAA